MGGILVVIIVISMVIIISCQPITGVWIGVGVGVVGGITTLISMATVGRGSMMMMMMMITIIIIIIVPHRPIMIIGGLDATVTTSGSMISALHVASGWPAIGPNTTTGDLLIVCCYIPKIGGQVFLRGEIFLTRQAKKKDTRL